MARSGTKADFSPPAKTFNQRELRHAGVFAVGTRRRCGHLGRLLRMESGFAVGGWGGMFVGTIIITIMYLGLTYSIAR